MSYTLVTLPAISQSVEKLTWRVLGCAKKHCKRSNGVKKHVRTPQNDRARKRQQKHFTVTEMKVTCFTGGKVHDIMIWSQNQDSCLNFVPLNLVTLGKSLNHSLYQFTFHKMRIMIFGRVMRIKWHD